MHLKCAEDTRQTHTEREREREREPLGCPAEGKSLHAAREPGALSPAAARWLPDSNSLPTERARK